MNFGAVVCVADRIRVGGVEKMRERLSAYVDHALQGIPMGAAALELREELLGNMEDRFRDLVAEGRSEEEAFRVTVEAVGDIRSVFLEANGGQGTGGQDMGGYAEAAQGQYKGTGRDTGQRRRGRAGLIAGIVMLAGVAAIVLAVSNISRMNGSGPLVLVGYQEVDWVNTQELDLAGVESLEINYKGCSMDVQFFEGDSDKLVVKEYMFEEVSQGQLAKIERSPDGKKLVVASGRTRNVMMIGGIMVGNERVEVYLPVEYRGALSVSATSGDIRSKMDLELGGSFKAETSSGDIQLQSVSASETTAGATSGDITLDKVAGTGSITASSGKIIVRSVTGDFSVETTSGDVKLEEISSGVKVRTSSGDITLDGVEGAAALSATSGQIMVSEWNGSGSVRTSSGDMVLRVGTVDGDLTLLSTSGDIRLQANEVGGNLGVESSSGSVTLELPEEPGFSFQASTSSGDIITWFDEMLSFNKKGNQAEGEVGTVLYSLAVNTTSGDIRIRKK